LRKEIPAVGQTGHPIRLCRTARLAPMTFLRSETAGFSANRKHSCKIY
jgi:hypothetical protein